MKKLIFMILIFLLALSSLAGQSAAPADEDRAAIEQAALDYIDGYYEGSGERMERALSPSLTKRGLIFSPRSGASYLQQMNSDTLIDVTRSGRGKLPLEQRLIDYRLLDLCGQTAAVRVFSAKVKDYLHLAKQGDRWRIVNVLWRLPLEKEAVDAVGEKEAIRMRLEEFREAMSKGNHERLAGILHPAVVLHALVPAAEPGKLVLLERNADSLLDRTRAGTVGAIADFRIEVQDVYGDIAAAKIGMGGSTQYLHLAKQDGEWRIVNSLQDQSAAVAAALQPPAVGEPMPAFTLASIQGKSVSIAGLKGKNVLIVFPRGRVGDHWCQICHYQYAELAELEQRLQLRKKYNLEILFVLPYDRATIEHWVEIFPVQMAVIEEWKNPADPARLSEGGRRWMETTRRLFPKKFKIEKGNIPTPFPILIDCERTVSRGLDLFTLLWDRSRVEQNVPAVYLIDRRGNLSFKYLSQNTMDRPGADYLLEVLDKFATR